MRDIASQQGRRQPSEARKAAREEANEGGREGGREGRREGGREGERERKNISDSIMVTCRLRAMVVGCRLTHPPPTTHHPSPTMQTNLHPTTMPAHPP